MCIVHTVLSNVNDKINYLLEFSEANVWYEGLGKLATTLETIKKMTFRRPWQKRKSRRLSQSTSMPLLAAIAGFVFMNAICVSNRSKRENHSRREASKPRPLSSPLQRSERVCPQM